MPWWVRVCVYAYLERAIPMNETSQSLRRRAGWCLAVFAAVAITTEVTSHAQSLPAPPSPRHVSFLYRMAVEVGGDDIITVTSNNGDDKTITGGGLLALNAGVLYQSDAPWAMEATLGYKFQTLSYENGDVSFSRFPLDLIASVRQGGFRAGAGPTIHLGPEFKCNVGGVCDGNVGLDTAFGAVFQLAYGLRSAGRPNVAVELGLRYTYIKYGKSDVSMDSIDGSCVGFMLGGWL